MQQGQKHIGYVYLKQESSIRHPLYVCGDKTYYVNKYTHAEYPLNVSLHSLDRLEISCK